MVRSNNISRAWKLISFKFSFTWNLFISDLTTFRFSSQIYSFFIISDYYIFHSHWILILRYFTLKGNIICYNQIKLFWDYGKITSKYLFNNKFVIKNCNQFILVESSGQKIVFIDWAVLTNILSISKTFKLCLIPAQVF